MSHSFNKLNQQRGGALITALSILLVMTVLGISAMSTSALQERMAGNARDAEVAFEAAEAALRAAETYLAAPATNIAADFSATGGLAGGRFLASNTSQWATAANWTTAGGHFALPTGTYSLHVAAQPQYIIEQVNATGIASPASTASSLEPINYTNNPPIIAGGARVFLITVRGFGLSANSRVMLQSYFGIN